MKLRYRLAMLFWGLSQLIPCSAAAQQHFPSDEDLRGMLRYLVEDGAAEGIVVGILEADGSTRIVSYGSAGPDARPLGPGSVFEIGSVTKTFTATLLAHMVERGEVALDDPVSAYLPSGVTVPAFGDREITLLDLATHTSGIEEQALVQLLLREFPPADLQDPWSDYSVETLYAWLPRYELRREPGTAYDYSNFGAGLLGHALARAAGMSLPELMRQRLLEPLGLSVTRYAIVGEPAPSMVQGHQAGEVASYWFAGDAVQGAGGLRSNAEDLLTFLQANVGTSDSDLTPAMRLAHSGRRSTDDQGGMIGLIWRSYTLNGKKLVWHGGTTAGFRSQIVFDPEQRVGAVVLANSSEFGDNLATDLVVHHPRPASAGLVALPESLARYVGEYVSAQGLRMYIRRDREGHLTAQPAGEVRMSLYAESDSAFFTMREEWGLIFRENDQDVVTEFALAVHTPGSERDISFARIGERAPTPAVVAGNEIPPVSAEDIARYEGTYDLQLDGQTLEYAVFEDDGTLMSRLGRTTAQLVPLGGHEFMVTVDPNIRVVFAIQNGRAVSVTVSAGPRSDSGTRRR